MSKKVGYSLSNCLRSIVKDRIPLDDVVFIMTSTAYDSREDMIVGLSVSMLGKDLDTHLANAGTLWDTGRIFQPSVRPYGRRPVDLLWRMALPEEIAMDAEIEPMTVHKSQGGTWDSVFGMPGIEKSFSAPMRERNDMIETAILRTSEPIVESPKTIREDAPYQPARFHGGPGIFKSASGPDVFKSASGSGDPDTTDAGIDETE